MIGRQMRSFVFTLSVLVSNLSFDITYFILCWIILGPMLDHVEVICELLERIFRGRHRSWWCWHARNPMPVQKNSFSDRLDPQSRLEKFNKIPLQIIWFYHDQLRAVAQGPSESDFRTIIRGKRQAKKEVQISFLRVLPVKKSPFSDSPTPFDHFWIERAAVGEEEDVTL